jgi:proteasome accessory factor C
MSDRATEQLRRVLQVLPQLADGNEHALAEVAARAGMDVETLRSDLVTLISRENEPGGFVEGVQLYLEGERVSLVSSSFRRPMRLTVSELCALELGLAMLSGERPPDEQRAIERARGRLREVIARLPAEPLPDPVRHAEVGAAIDVEHLAAVRTALRDRRKLSLAYRAAGAVETTERIVCPYALAVVSGMFYVVAFCDSSDGVRIFRLDRVESAVVTADGFERPADFTVDGVLTGGKAFHSEGEVREATVRYSPRIARWIAEREGRQLEADGGLTISHPVADSEWLIGHVLQYGPDAEVVEPETTRAAVAGRLLAMRDNCQTPMRD